MSHSIYGTNDEYDTPERLILRNHQMALEALIEMLAGNTSAAHSLPDLIHQNRRLFQRLGVDLPNLDPFFDGVVRRIAEERRVGIGRD